MNYKYAKISWTPSDIQTLAPYHRPPTTNQKPMSEINYSEIKSIVQKGVKAGLISDPVPMRRHHVVTETHKSPRKQRANKLDICEERADELLVWYSQGWTQIKMAKELGMSYGPVATFFRNRKMKFNVGAYKRKPKLSKSELFADLVRLHGEQNGGIENFYALDETTIGCRYGDCCIRLNNDGWHYGRNVPAHPTPAQAFENRASDYHSENNFQD